MILYVDYHYAKLASPKGALEVEDGWIDIEKGIEIKFKHEPSEPESKSVICWAHGTTAEIICEGRIKAHDERPGVKNGPASPTPINKDRFPGISFIFP
jgi:hypothetical protein